MSRIAERAEIGVVGRDDDRAPAVRQDSMELFHRSDDIGDVLNHMDGANFTEDAVANGVWVVIQISDDVGACSSVAIEADSSRVFVKPAAYIQDGFRAERSSYCSRATRHCSSVSTA